MKLLHATDWSCGLGNHLPKSPTQNLILLWSRVKNSECFSHLSSSVSRQQTGADFEKCRIAHHRVGEKGDEQCSDGRGGILRVCSVRFALGTWEEKVIYKMREVITPLLSTGGSQSITCLLLEKSHFKKCGEEVTVQIGATLMIKGSEIGFVRKRWKSRICLMSRGKDEGSRTTVSKHKKGFY